MKVRFAQPCPLLQPYIERYWGWTATDKEPVYMPLVPPGAGADLFLHDRAPFSIRSKGQLSSSHLILSCERPSLILPSDDVGFIAIRFRAGMLKNLVNIPLVALQDCYPDVVALWGKKGRELLERVGEQVCFTRKVSCLDTFLTGLLHLYKKDDCGWNSIIRELFDHADTVRLDQLSEKLGISYRQFRRRFIGETGMGPKHFQQLARFHATLKPLLLEKEKRYLSTALGQGYFDQMHFIREFKYFMQLTPSEYLQENNFTSHFYYARL